MAVKTRCLVVDDHTVVRQGLDLLFGDLEDLELVGEVTNGEEALDAVERLQPEVVLMDVRLPGIDGVSAVKRIHQASPHTKFVIFSAYGDKRLLSDAIAAGGPPARDPHGRRGQGVRRPVALPRADHAGRRRAGAATLRARARDPPAA